MTASTLVILLSNTYALLNRELYPCPLVRVIVKPSICLLPRDAVVIFINTIWSIRVLRPSIVIAGRKPFFGYFCNVY